MTAALQPDLSPNPALAPNSGRLTPAEQLNRLGRHLGQWFARNLPQALIATLSGFAIGWAANFLIMAFLNDGYRVANGRIASGQGNVQNAMIVWSLASAAVFGLIGYWRAVGAKKFLADMRGWPGSVGEMFRKDGPRVWMHVLWGMAISLLAAGLVSRWAALAAGMLLGGTALSPLGRVLAALITQLWRGAMREIMPSRQSRATGSQGLFVGLFTSALVLAAGLYITSPIEKLVAGSIVLALALVLAWRKPQGATAALLVLLGGTAVWILLPGISLADDGGFKEAGGTMKAWMASGGIKTLSGYAMYGGLASGVGAGAAFALGASGGAARPPDGGWGDGGGSYAANDDGGGGGGGIQPATDGGDPQVFGDPGPQILDGGDTQPLVDLAAQANAVAPNVLPDWTPPLVDANGNAIDPNDPRWGGKPPIGDPGTMPGGKSIQHLTNEDLQKMRVPDGDDDGAEDHDNDIPVGIPDDGEVKKAPIGAREGLDESLPPGPQQTLRGADDTGGGDAGDDEEDGDQSDEGADGKAEPQHDAKPAPGPEPPKPAAPDATGGKKILPQAPSGELPHTVSRDADTPEARKALEDANRAPTPPPDYDPLKGMKADQSEEDKNELIQKQNVAFEQEHPEWRPTITAGQSELTDPNAPPPSDPPTRSRDLQELYDKRDEVRARIAEIEAERALPPDSGVLDKAWNTIKNMNVGSYDELEHLKAIDAENDVRINLYEKEGAEAVNWHDNEEKKKFVIGMGGQILNQGIGAASGDVMNVGGQIGRGIAGPDLAPGPAVEPHEYFSPKPYEEGPISESLGGKAWKPGESGPVVADGGAAAEGAIGGVRGPVAEGPSGEGPSPSGRGPALEQSGGGGPGAQEPTAGGPGAQGAGEASTSPAASRGVASTDPPVTQTDLTSANEPTTVKVETPPDGRPPEAGGTVTTSGPEGPIPPTSTSDHTADPLPPAAPEAATPAQPRELQPVGAPNEAPPAKASAGGEATPSAGAPTGSAESATPSGGKGSSGSAPQDAATGKPHAPSAAGGEAAPQEPGSAGSHSAPEPGQSADPARPQPFTDSTTGVTITHSIDGTETTVHFKVGEGIQRGGMENFLDTVPDYQRAHAAPPNLGVEDPAGLAPSPRSANLSADPRIDNFVQKVYEGRPPGTDLNVEVAIRRDPATGYLAEKTYRLEYTAEGRPAGSGTHVATFGYEVGAGGRIIPKVIDAGNFGAGLLGR